jgi:hypothetical protein
MLRPKARFSHRKTGKLGGKITENTPTNVINLPELT